MATLFCSFAADPVLIIRQNTCCSSRRNYQMLPPSFSSYVTCKSHQIKDPLFSRNNVLGFRRSIHVVVKNSSSPSGDSSQGSDENLNKEKVPFGYTRKDVLLIGLGVTVVGIGLKFGLEFSGVDPLQAGNVVQLVMVLGLTVGWISTYIFRVSNKDMTYAQQLRDYESKVLEKRLESLSEADLEALLEQVDEEKRLLATDEQVLE
ncbi:hypothetical protein HPP92_019433 [Vanilla planifolia]|uniref:Uncharacterized protein n=1 Tax=Vanilla planifolia TaxID=51239 RepID=A0A835Q5D6_VANPL|nr:hypothetical protein HPP92_019433 [Vanilla planifolia]